MSNFALEEDRCARLDRFEQSDMESYIELLDQAGTLEAHLICQTISDLPRTGLVTKIHYQHSTGSHFSKWDNFKGQTFNETTFLLAFLDATNYARWNKKSDAHLNFESTAIRHRAEQIFFTYSIFHLKF